MTRADAVRAELATAEHAADQAARRLHKAVAAEVDAAVNPRAAHRAGARLAKAAAVVEEADARLTSARFAYQIVTAGLFVADVIRPDGALDLDPGDVPGSVS